MQPDFIIQEDAASVLLKTRWMACYTLRDSYPGHASRCFESLDQRRRGQIIAIFSRSDHEPSEQDITAAYNKILAQEIEDSVQTAIEEWGGDRATVEVEIAKTIHELFDVFGENPRPVIQESTEETLEKANLICHFEKRRKNKCENFLCSRHCC